MSATATEATRFDPGPWQVADRELGLTTPPAQEALPIGMRRRRGFTPAQQDARASAALHDVDGLLRWVYQPPPAQVLRGRARRAGLFGLGQPLMRFDFEDIGPNRVGVALAALDGKLSANPGLKQWQSGAWVPAAPGPRKGRTLLLVHGTFSSSEMWREQLQSTPRGQQLLTDWTATYGANLLAFTHPTLSVGPWINALDLQQALAGVTGEIDIVCHSRGGLVASWLLRLAPVRARSVTFVGSPLHGTSLASPHRLRAMLDGMANIANALQAAGMAASAVFPLAAGAAGLAKVLGKTLSLGAQLPLADAAVALVPGLASQQRITNNPETERLFAAQWLSAPRYAMVSSNFEPNLNQPWWKFWTRLRDPLLQGANLVADALFPGDNDLVVDTASMADLGTLAVGVPRHLALGRNDRVFHTNYFLQPDVLDFIGQQTLGKP